VAINAGLGIVFLQRHSYVGYLCYIIYMHYIIFISVYVDIISYFKLAIEKCHISNVVNVNLHSVA